MNKKNCHWSFSMKLFKKNWVAAENTAEIVKRVTLLEIYLERQPVMNNEWHNDCRNGITFLVSDYGNKIMSNVNKIYNRVYFVPQLGMFHREISVLITIDVYKCTYTLPVKSVEKSKMTTTSSFKNPTCYPCSWTGFSTTRIKVYFKLEIYLNRKTTTTKKKPLFTFVLKTIFKHQIVIKTSSFISFGPTFDW